MPAAWRVRPGVQPGSSQTCFREPFPVNLLKVGQEEPRVWYSRQSVQQRWLVRLPLRLWLQHLYYPTQVVTWLSSISLRPAFKESLLPVLYCTCTSIYSMGIIKVQVHVSTNAIIEGPWNFFRIRVLVQAVICCYTHPKYISQVCVLVTTSIMNIAKTQTNSLIITSVINLQVLMYKYLQLYRCWQWRWLCPPATPDWEPDSCDIEAPRLAFTCSEVSDAPSSEKEVLALP